jgi:hypothetical protein
MADGEGCVLGAGLLTRATVLNLAFMLIAYHNLYDTIKEFLRHGWSKGGFR